MNIQSNPLMKPVVKMVNNKGFSNFAQTTMYAVGAETLLKAIARPTFTLMDKKADEDARKFSAAKEFIYQMTCLSLFFAVLTPYRHVAFKMGKKFLKNNPAVQKLKSNNINNFKEFDKLPNEVQKKDYAVMKGFIETNSIVASVVTLTMLAPKVAHKFAHSILRAIGLEKPHEDKKEKPAAIKLNA